MSILYFYHYITSILSILGRIRLTKTQSPVDRGYEDEYHFDNNFLDVLNNQLVLNAVIRGEEIR